MRQATINRTTAETDISLLLALDGRGDGDINSGCGFLDHMLTLFAKHGGFDLVIRCEGDTEVDYHHSVEDIGICLGLAFKEALGDCRGITRYGSFLLPMDEALVLTALDISGRAYLCFDVPVNSEKVGDFDCELVQEFMLAFSRSMGLTLHIKALSGLNTHHIFEAAFKGLGRALRQAVAVDARFAGDIPSSKGVI